MTSDHAVATVLGLAVGDALGAPFEFCSREEATAAVEAGLEMAGGRGWDPGEWTDDTSMALCLAECIGAHGCPLDLDDLALRYSDWAASGPKDIGITTARSLNGAGSAADARAKAEVQHERSGKTAGNGTVMRAAPLGLVPGPAAVIFNAAREDARLTHWDPVAGDASAALCAALIALRNGDEPVAVALAEAGEHPSLQSALELVQAGERDQVGKLAGGPKGGTCWATLAVGLCALEFDSYEEGVGWAISHGFDTDTNAAVAGTLLGCRHGVDGIPERWLSMLLGRERLDSAANALAAGVSAG